MHTYIKFRNYAWIPIYASVQHNEHDFRTRSLLHYNIYTCMMLYVTRSCVAHVLRICLRSPQAHNQLYYVWSHTSSRSEALRGARNASDEYAQFSGVASQISEPNNKWVCRFLVYTIVVVVVVQTCELASALGQELCSCRMRRIYIVQVVYGLATLRHFPHAPHCRLLLPQCRSSTESPPPRPNPPLPPPIMAIRTLKMTSGSKVHA